MTITNKGVFLLKNTLFISVCFMQQTKTPAENILPGRRTMFCYILTVMWRTHPFLYKAAGSSACRSCSLGGHNCYRCCLWRCHDKCEGQACWKMYRSFICWVCENAAVNDPVLWHISPKKNTLPYFFVFKFSFYSAWQLFDTKWQILHLAQEAERLIDFEFACLLCLLVAACYETLQMRSNDLFFIIFTFLFLKISTHDRSFS